MVLAPMLLEHCGTTWHHGHIVRSVKSCLKDLPLIGLRRNLCALRHFCDLCRSGWKIARSTRDEHSDYDVAFSSDVLPLLLKELILGLVLDARPADCVCSMPPDMMEGTSSNLPRYVDRKGNSLLSIFLGGSLNDRTESATCTK